MESMSNESLSRIASHSMRLKTASFIFSLVCVCPVSSAARCHSQEPGTASSHFSATSDIRLDTPKSTTATWVNAVNKRDWREEYNCYTGTQQARFAYQVMVSTRELKDSHDLSIELSRIFQNYSFPSSLLDKFPSTRMDLSNLHDQNLIQSAIDSQNEKRQEQLDLWEREIQPWDIDWSSMIGDLQPLLTRSYQRHKHDNHPSSTGIAHHLSCHRFVTPSNLKIVGKHAEGRVVAIVCDPTKVADEDADGREPSELKVIPAWIDRGIQKLPIVEPRVKRPAEKISLVREREGWKLDLVPFR